MPIESDEYRQEVEELKKDPIIIEMYNELPAAYYNVIGFLDSFQFMVRSAQEYRDRGGNPIGRTIGGPAKAIKALHEDTMEREKKGNQ